MNIPPPKLPLYGSHAFCGDHFIVLTLPCIDDNPVNGGFHVELVNGTKKSEDCVFNTLIVLGCNKSAKWPDSGDLSDLIVPIYDEHCQVQYLQYTKPHYYVLCMLSITKSTHERFLWLR